MSHNWEFIRDVKARILGIKPRRGGIPAIERIAKEVGAIVSSGNFFICLIELIDNLWSRGKRIIARIPYKIK